MIQIAVVGDGDAAYHIAKKGFAVIGVEPEIESHVSRAGGTFIFFGKKQCKLNIFFNNLVDAISKMVESADLIIIGQGEIGKFVKKIADLKRKPYVEGTGKAAMEKAAEKLIRFNLFGTK